MNIQQARREIKRAKENNFTELNLSSSLGDRGQLTSKDLEELVSEIADLKNLRSLELWDNQITNITFLSELKNLHSIALSRNRISNIFPLSKLKNLRHLDLRGNRISDISALAELKNLHSLNLWDNQISDISTLAELKNLHSLDLSENQINDIDALVQLGKLEKLDLRVNKGLEEKIPLEILEEYKKPQTIINYYIEITRGKTKSLNEAKIVVIGDGDVGKTTLINRLLENRFVETNRTHGIEINHWENVELEDGRKVKLNVWDFGGQEIMHSMHQFFFTENTLYILVIDARRNLYESQTEEWLNRITVLAKNSPVIIVGNKIDTNSRSGGDQNPGYFDINRRELEMKFPNIKGFYGVSSLINLPEYNELFNIFKKNLINEISQLPSIHQKIPLNWFIVKKQLEEMNASRISYITYNEYLYRCIQASVTSEIEQHILLEFLNDLGAVLSFQDDKQLRDIGVLNPKWLTKGVYAIIDNSRVYQNKGVFEKEILKEALDEKEYPPDARDFIIQMMQKFELCVEIVPNKTFLIPDLLPKDHLYTGEWNNTLRFKYHYEIYLKSIFTRFLVRMFRYVYMHTYWRNGVVLELEGNKALIIAYNTDKEIQIFIDGNPNTRRNSLAIIRKEFNEIHNNYGGLEITEKVGHPKYPELFRDYVELLMMEEDGLNEVFIKELRQSLSIRDFLDGIETPNERLQNREREEILNINKIESPLLLDKSKRIEIERLEKDLERLVKEKEDLENRAIRTSRIIVGVPTGILVLFLGFWIYLIFIKGWEFMEPISYVITIVFALMLLVIPAFSARDWNPTKFAENIYENQKRKSYADFGINIKEIEVKKSLLRKLRSEIEKLR